MRAIAVALLLSGCGPLVCTRLEIGILPHPVRPRPAGRVVVMCDGRAVVQAEAPTVTTGAP